MPTFVIDGKEQMLDDLGPCPACSASWDAGAIFDALRPQEWCSDKSDDELRDYINKYYEGSTKHFSRLIGIEIQGLYDGVIMWECPDCKTRWDRFKNRPSHRAGKAATI
jgi:hypothetical protein